MILFEAVLRGTGGFLPDNTERTWGPNYSAPMRETTMKRIRQCLPAFILAALLAVVLAPRAQAAEPAVRIAFIDSGISTKHIAQDQVAAGKNYVFPEADTQDRIGHGTATAGLVLGAEDQGIIGVCPDALAVPLVVVDAYPSGTIQNGGPAALCDAIYDAVDLFDCQIINISLCTTQDSAELRAAADYAESRGVILIAAVGNDGEDGQTYYPAAYETVVAVGSADGDQAAAFSQDGADILAPGTGLLTATNRNADTPTSVAGTSYSCTIISGICARILAAYPAMTPAEMRQCLFGLATDMLEPGFDRRSGWGVVATNLDIPSPYWDVPETLWSRDSILQVSGQGLMNGIGGGRFAPDEAVTRAMFATILYRLSGTPAVTGQLGFHDVDAGAYYADAVVWASEMQIMEGYGNGLFGPDDPVTREQVVALFWRYNGRPITESTVLADFADTEEISPWATDAFSWAVSLGIVNGPGDGTLAPGGTATRAEIAQLVAAIAAML